VRGDNAAMDEAVRRPDEFLESIGTEAAAELRGLGTRRRYPAGTAILLEGDVAHGALVLLDGAVKLSVGSAEGDEVILDVLEAGSLVGELSVIDGRPRSATVTALSPVEVLAVGAGAFNDFLERHPPVMRGLLVDVIDRLRTREAVVKALRALRQLGWAESRGRTIAIHELDLVRRRAAR